MLLLLKGVGVEQHWTVSALQGREAVVLYYLEEVSVGVENGWQACIQGNAIGSTLCDVLLLGRTNSQNVQHLGPLHDCKCMQYIVM